MKKHVLVIVIIAVLQSFQNAKAESSLPLTATEVAKLQRLFPSASKDKVPEFKAELSHEHVIWNQTPIDVILPVGKERMISFPVSVDFGYDKSVLSDEKLKAQNNNGTLYLVAKAAFPAQRVQVRCSDTGQIILMNLSAQGEASTTPLDIIIAKKSNQVENQSDNANDTDETNSLPGIQNEKITAITLTRFAAEELYAPKRLLVQPPNIFRTPMHVSKTIALVLDGSVIAMPLASWRGGDLFVTAILLRNQLKQEIQLDPRNLCGTWQAATFFPKSVLGPTGTEKDSTTVFLVGNRPFAECLQSCTRGY